MTITLAVSERIATVTTDSRPVGGNQYPFTMSLDGEWTGTLYLRVRFADRFYDIPFQSTDTSVMVQFPIGYPEVGIGIYSEALQICTNEARVRLRPSILEQGGSPVEFDSTLYEQWAGEVTELVTDADWSTTSTHPLQNRVLTAWKETVALDANAVHKTGNETVDGYKTFLQSPIVSRASPGLTLTTTRTSTDTGEKFTINGFAGSELRGKVCQIRNASDEYLALRQYKVDGTSGYYDFRIRTDSSGNGWAEAPTFTADNNADTKIVTRAMLATTPTVVHTTGNETVAGQKTFSGAVYANDLRRGKVSVALAPGEWAKVYEFTPYRLGSGVWARIYNDYRPGDMPYAVMMANVGNANAYTPSGRLVGTSTFIAGKMAKRASDNVVEVWIKNAMASTNLGLACEIEHLRNIVPTVVGEKGDEPVAGDTYSSVVDMVVVS